MNDIKERIAELVWMLPMMIGVSLEGYALVTPVKLNLSEIKTLMFLHKNEGSPMTEYSKKVGLTRGSFTTVADRLEKKGLIERAPVSADRRINALLLTPEGKRVARQIDDHFNRHIAGKMACLDDRDLNNLKNALETINATVEKLQLKK